MNPFQGSVQAKTAFQSIQSCLGSETEDWRGNLMRYSPIITIQGAWAIKHRRTMEPHEYTGKQNHCRSCYNTYMKQWRVKILAHEFDDHPFVSYWHCKKCKTMRSSDNRKLKTTPNQRGADGRFVRKSRPIPDRPRKETQPCRLVRRSNGELIRLKEYLNNG